MSQPQPSIPQKPAFTPTPIHPPHMGFVGQQQQPAALRISPGPHSPFPSNFSASPGQTTPGVVTPTTHGAISPSQTSYSNHNSQPQHQTQTHPQSPHSASYAPHTTQHMQNGRLLNGSNTARASMPGQPAGNTVPSRNTAGATANNNNNNNNTNHVTNTQSIRSPQLPQMSQSPQPQSAATPYTSSGFAVVGTPSAATMGPPSHPVHPNASDAARQASVAAKPAPVKTYAYDMDDTLAGTGINLDEEEQFMNDFETRIGFGAFVPGGRGSFYGAGPANQPPEQIQVKSEDELMAEVANQAWNDAAHRLAVSRAQDLREEGFIHPGMLHARLHKLSGANGLELNLDPKPPNPNMPLGRFSHPNQWDKPEIRVRTVKTPDGMTISTEGSFIPKDAYLIDQIALLSLATKEHMRELLSEANHIASTRQKTSHGAIPEEWIDAAEHSATMESAAISRTNPMKRPANEISNGLATPVSEVSPTNQVTDALLSIGKKEREMEEARLRKRQKRLDQATDKDKKDDGANTSRAGSVAPGTPGSVAPEQPEAKAPTKKEGKKAAKLAEATSSTVNSTVNQFMGRKGKKYSWMAGGGGGSGANTPRGGPAGGVPGTPVAGLNVRPTKGPLTQAPSHYLGQLREDSVRGKNIQLRDWVNVLEQSGSRADRRVLQFAYNKLDRSDWGDKAVIPASATVPTPTSARAMPPTPKPAPGPSTPAPASTPGVSTALAP